MNEKVAQLKTEVEDTLKHNILPYWIKNMVDSENGGFYGRITGKGVVEHNAPKGAVLNGRILWTYSAAYRISKDEPYLQIAKRDRKSVV